MLVRVAAMAPMMIRFRYIGRKSHRAGFTLLEVIVVLLLLSIAAAVVAPSLLPSRAEPVSELRTLVDLAAQQSVRQGQMLTLRIEPSGVWQILAGAAPARELLASGRLSQRLPDGVDLVLSPLGTCAPAAGRSASRALGTYDPIMCEGRPS